MGLFGRSLSICGSEPISAPYTLYKWGRGGGGGEVNQREGGRGNSLQSWVENTNMTQIYKL
jgi:hypothetical protein